MEAFAHSTAPKVSTRLLSMSAKLAMLHVLLAKETLKTVLLVLETMDTLSMECARPNAPSIILPLKVNASPAALSAKDALELATLASTAKLDTTNWDQAA